jgi:hypothetical protein
VLRYALLSIFILCFITEVLKSQTRKAWVFQACVKDCTNGRSIAYAEVYNESSRKGVFADSLGIFRMYVGTGDTLIVQSLSYLGRVCFIRDYSSSTIDTVELCPQSYEIGEVQIELPHSYKDFKRTFLAIEPDRGLQIEGLPKAKIQDIPSLMDTNYLNSDHFAIFNPVNYLYYKYSKEEQSKRKVFYLERQKREQLIIDRKYNRQIIEQITGLEGDSITAFITFCNLSHQFLYEATELEIVEIIDKKYSEYKKHCP